MPSDSHSRADRERADDVAAPADAEHQRALGPRDDLQRVAERRAQAGTGSAVSAISRIAARGAVELLVGHHRRALEGQVAVDLDPRVAAVVLVADADRDRPRDPVDPQQQHVERVAPLPAQALARVVGRPDVEGARPVDDPRVVGLEVVGDLGPGADADAVGLRDAAVLQQGPRRRLLVGPDALLERAPQLRVVGLAHEVVALVVEGRVEEELLVLELEVLVLLADPALAEGDELLALGRARAPSRPIL